LLARNLFASRSSLAGKSQPSQRAFPISKSRVAELSFVRGYLIIFHGALFVGALEAERKKPLLTSGTAAFARRFCSALYLFPRIGQESGSQSGHRGYLLPGWQTAAFAAAIPNA